MFASPADRLSAAAETFQERNAIYGDGWVRVGLLIEALFPEGVKLLTAKDHERFSQIILLAVKLTRYCNNFNAGGHRDSVHDMITYAAILESIDAGEFDANRNTNGVSDGAPGRGKRT